MKKNFRLFCSLLLAFSACVGILLPVGKSNRSATLDATTFDETISAEKSSIPASKKPNLVSGTFFDVFGTDIRFEFFDDLDNIQADDSIHQKEKTEILAIFSEMEALLSTTIPTSDIARFNNSLANEKIEVSATTIEVIQKAQELFRVTNGAFNPAVFLLADLWQLSNRFSQEDFEPQDYDRPLFTLPSQKYVDAFKKLTDFSKVLTNAQDNTLTKPGDLVEVDGKSYSMKIDLGGLAKGVALEKAKQVLQDNKTKGWLSVGGSSIWVSGSNEKSLSNNISVGLVNPENAADYYALLSLKDTGVTTSGDYQVGRHFQLNGKNYCHIINAKTGAPIDTNIRTATVVSQDSSLADALTTALMTMTFDQAKQFAFSAFAKENNIQIFLVYEKKWLLGNVFEVVTNAKKTDFRLANADFRITGFSDENGQFVYRPAMPNLWLAIFLIVGSSAIVSFVLFKKRSSIFCTMTIAEKTCLRYEKLKANRRFKKWDVVALSFVALLVVALLLTFVVFPKKHSLDAIHVYHENVQIFEYVFETKIAKITSANFEKQIEIIVDNNKTIVVITLPNKKTNTISIENNSAKMIESSCSQTKECVNSFPTLVNDLGTIICNVNHLKVVGFSKNSTNILLVK